ncbi:MAG: adenylate cyclase, partial [Desulfobulbaceae bacterium]|nr:adenylate cyclase [Desulfobulbaceae bacterium]
MKNRLDRLLAYNRNRMVKAMRFNKNKADIYFKVLPFLLHSNYPDLPGYIEDEKCLFGIHRFQPEKVLDFELFRKFFPKSTALSERTPSPFTENPCIHSLKTIGSIGTVAQTTKSDCDYWVSVKNDELGPEGLELLSQKCKAIEEWALERDTEVYFFLMDIDQTRENSFDSAAEEESAGSALKLLLKDELFRTHIMVAGKMPLWWLIPPGLTEEGYREYVDAIYKS